MFTLPISSSATIVEPFTNLLQRAEMFGRGTIEQLEREYDTVQ